MVENLEQGSLQLEGIYVEKGEVTTTKYVIHAEIDADGIVEKPDVVGAIFGQTEGLLGEDLDLRELQKTGRIGRIEVEIHSTGGKTHGSIIIPSSLDKVETAVLAAALESIDKVGPCKAEISVLKIEDVRAAKRRMVIDRAREILTTLFEEITPESQEITEEVKQSIRTSEIIDYGPERLPAGPAVGESDAIIVVEGRADVLILLKHGIKNAIAVEGTNIPQTIVDISKEKTVTAFVDGDRGGELIIKELLQVAEVDYVARAPEGKEVEELTYKEIIKALRNKIPAEQATPMLSLEHIEPERAEFKRRPHIPRRREHFERREYFERAQPRFEQEEKLDEKSERLLDILESLAGSLKAHLLDSDLNLMGEVLVRDLTKTLQESTNKIYAVVFDGVVTQRLIDLANEKGISFLVGVKTGNIINRPPALKILSSGNFEKR